MPLSLQTSSVAFHHGNDTYVFNDTDSNSTVSSGDGIVKLTEVTADPTPTNYVRA